MNLLLTEEQTLIRDTIQGVVKKNLDTNQLRAYRDEKDPHGYSQSLWRHLSDQGWLGLMIPTEQGGMGLGLTEASLFLEAVGSRVSPEPFLSTLILAAETFLRDEDTQRASRWLERLMSGNTVVSWAHEEPKSRYERTPRECWLEKKDDSWLLSGQKSNVLDGHVADAFLVTARHSGDDEDSFSIVLVSAQEKGVSRKRQWRMDGRNAARLSFDKVEVANSDFVSPKEGGAALLDVVCDLATIGQCSEMLGGMTEALDMTLDYLRTRTQFSVPIGSFQALQHRAARMFQKMSMARVAVLAAAKEADAQGDDLSRLTSMAKVLTGDAYMHIANEAVQMHGGIGMTDEHPIGWYLKRARADQSLFGDSSWHRDRWARLNGY